MRKIGENKSEAKEEYLSTYISTVKENEKYCSYGRETFQGGVSQLRFIENTSERKKISNKREIDVPEGEIEKKQGDKQASSSLQNHPSPRSHDLCIEEERSQFGNKMSCSRIFEYIGFTCFGLDLRVEFVLGPLLYRK